MCAERYFLPELEAGRAIDDHLIMAARNVAPGRELAWATGAARLEAHQKHAERLAVQFGLHRLIGHGAGAFHTINSADEFPGVARDARSLGKGPICAGLNYPEVDVRGARLPQRFINHASVDTGDHDDDAKQQAQSEIGQDEPEQIVLDVPVGQVHRLASSAILAARPARSPLRICTTTCDLSGRPSVTS